VVVVVAGDSGSDLYPRMFKKMEAVSLRKHMKRKLSVRCDKTSSRRKKTVVTDLLCACVINKQNDYFVCLIVVYLRC